MKPEFRPSGQSPPGTVGTLFQGSPATGSAEGIGKARGLYLAVANASTEWSAQVQVSYGTTGGGQDSRTFTLTRQGAWLDCAGWSFAKGIILAVGDSATIVSYAWTTDPPVSGPNLLLVASVVNGENTIPRGARSVALAVAEAGARWRTNQDAAGDLDIGPFAIAAGAVVPVLGALLVLTGANTAAWLLDPP